MLLLFCLSCSFVIAQKKKPTGQGNKLANQYHAGIATIKKTAKYEADFDKSCNPKSKLSILKPRDLFPDKKNLGFHMDSLLFIFERYGGFREIYAISTTDNYQDYLKELGVKNITDLQNPEYTRKEYDILKNLKKNDFKLGIHKFSKKGCAYTVENKFIPSKWTIKQTDKEKKTWTSYYEVRLLIRVNVNCSCKGKTTSDVKSAIFEYEGAGLFETKIFFYTSKYYLPPKTNFKFLKKPESTVKLKQAFCCETEDISYEEPSIYIQSEEIGFIPNQTIGGFIGAGFQDNFEETTFNIGAEYLHTISQIGNSPLMVGGAVNYATTSYFETTTSGIAIGPTAQLFTPVTPNNSVFIANGVTAQYEFGSQDSFGFESSFSGVNVLLNTGVHIPLNEQLGISAMVPVLSFQSTTFKPDGGGESISDSNVGLFLRNRSAIKVGVRFGF